jgi:hypothetical protein
MKSCAGRDPTTKCRWRHSEVVDFSVIARDEPPMCLRDVAVGLPPQADARATSIEHFQRDVVITAASHNAVHRPVEEAATVIYNSTVFACCATTPRIQPMLKIMYAVCRSIAAAVNASANALETAVLCACMSSHISLKRHCPDLETVQAKCSDPSWQDCGLCIHPWFCKRPGAVPFLQQGELVRHQQGGYHVSR